METPQATSIVNKIETVLVTIFFAVAVFNLLKYVTEYDLWVNNSYEFNNNNTPFSPLNNYFIPTLSRYIVLYGSYLLFHFIAIKNIARRVAVRWNILLVFILFTIAVITYGVTDTWLKAYLFNDPTVNETRIYINLFAKNLTVILPYFGLYCCYCFVKYNPDILNNKVLGINLSVMKAVALRDTFVGAVCWFMILALIYMSKFGDGAAIVWLFVASVSVVLYAVASLSLIPYLKSEGHKIQQYFAWVTLLLGLAMCFVVVLFRYILHIQHSVQYIVFFNGFVQLGIVAPATWYIYEYRLRTNNEITGLKTALGQSSANLDFLRSQINPHFLFNALNTLYGTALQEHAERTGEGIQKLGDMMRFMLQENVQEQISLTREIDYLTNYIALQKLRTQTSPDINIQTEIDEQVSALQIAPMLLIPFVENAFKHGISLREPSHIKITLQVRDNKLFFDVSNSIHQKMDNDPEKYKSGIGLENVKQRLQLLYRGKHELVVRESAKEFFIHLTVSL